MLKKIVCFLLLICCMGGTAAAYGDTEETTYSEEACFFAAAGVLNGYDDGDFRLEENVTRAEFTAMIIRLQKLDEVGAADFTYYPDVEKNHWALQNINLATALGLVSGFSDGTFRPDSNITVEEAVKIIVSLLGYRPYAEANGGYPSGYINAALNNGILDGIKTAYTSYASRGDIVLMLYQSLDVYMYEFDGDSYRTGTKTILSDMMDLTKISGVITATKYANIIPINYINDNEIAVDSVRYKITDNFLQELVGYKITFYVRETDNDELLIVYYTIDEKNNNTVSVADTDINYSETTVNSLAYYDENGKTKALKINTDYVVVNGENVRLADKSIFNIKDGNIFAIDSDRDGKYETVFVNSARTVVAGRINKNNYIITDKFVSDRTVNLDEDLLPERTVVIRYLDEEITFSDLAENDVITVYESSDGSRVVAYVSRESVNGKITGTENSGEKYEITVNDAVYTMTASCAGDLNNNIEKKNAVTAGTDVQLYLDVNGRIAAVEIEGNSSEKYAFLIMGYVTADGTEAELKMWPEDGDVAVFKTSNKVIIDDGSTRAYYTAENIIPKLESTRLADSDSYIARPLFQLIKYTLNSEGKIRTIKTAAYSEDGTPLRKEGVFTRDFFAGSFQTNQKDMINGAYKFASDVKIFNIPPERDKFSEYQRSVSFSKNVTADMALYDMDEHNMVKAVLIINPDYDSYYDNSSYKPFFTFDHLVTAINSDDEVIYKAVGMYNRLVREFTFDADPGFVKGDVYQFLEVNEKVVKANQIYDAETGRFVKGAANDEGYGMSGKVTDEVVLAFMYVRDITDSTIILADGTRELMLNMSAATRYTIYDSENDEVRAMDSSEIQYGDKVAARTFNTTAGDLVVIR